jgi:RNA polymerase sigma factor (sigma-70 family)
MNKSDFSHEKIKFFHHVSFDDINQRMKIMGIIPEHKEFQKSLNKVQKIKTDKINPEMLPCYQSALLNFPQEQHLFRKLNFLKYRAKNLFANTDVKYPEAKKKLANHIHRKSLEVRNQIAECNFRLATQIMKHKNAMQDGNSTEQMLSDAYFDVLKAVDYFNWTLGHRFSTYATWVVKKNFFRDAKTKMNQAEKVAYLDDSRAEMIEDRGTGEADEKNHESRQCLIKRLIGMLVRENIGTDRVRQAYVLEKYFGVNGRDKMTLEQISEEVGVTKERVRQLKEKGLEWIRGKVEELGLSIDD